MFNKAITLTEEQEAAVEAGINFIRHGNHEDLFLIQGKAGTGKSTIIRKILKQFREKQIIISALSHKAKKVITESVKCENIRCSPLTIAAMLGMTLEEETGKFIRNFFNKKLPPISYAEIIVIDEGSMLNEEALSLIYQYKPYGSKIIVLADIGQLEPIRETPSEKPSPIFSTENKAMLTTRIRQGEGHPVLEYADFYWDNSQQEYPVNNPVPPEMRVNKEIGDSKILFYKSIIEIYTQLEQKFRDAISDFNPNKIKIVTYKNITRQDINKYFHNILFTDKETGDIREYNKGELIIFNDSYEQGLVNIENASEYQIKRVMSTKIMVDDCEIKVYSLQIDVYDEDDQYISVDIKTLAENSKETYKKYVSKLFAKAKALPEKSKERAKAMADAWTEKNRYANIDYAYAITSHKSQGSTYESVVVHESDILSTQISVRTKSRAIYTALTRAKNEVFII
jgi:nucleoside-triphosphatase THEP1